MTLRPRSKPRPVLGVRGRPGPLVLMQQGCAQAPGGSWPSAGVTVPGHRALVHHNAGLCAGQEGAEPSAFARAAAGHTRGLAPGGLFLSPPTPCGRSVHWAHGQVARPSEALVTTSVGTRVWGGLQSQLVHEGPGVQRRFIGDKGMPGAPPTQRTGRGAWDLSSLGRRTNRAVPWGFWTDCPDLLIRTQKTADFEQSSEHGRVQ